MQGRKKKIAGKVLPAERFFCLRRNYRTSGKKGDSGNRFFRKGDGENDHGEPYVGE